MNRPIFISLVLMVFIVLQASSQSASSVTVHKDPRIDLLISKQIEINEVTTRNARRSAPGYRILVISSNNRNKVTEAKSTIYQQFPELKGYMMYQSPFFRLKVGNFRDRTEAETYLSAIQKLFQGGVYIVPDTIEVKPEKNDSE